MLQPFHHFRTTGSPSGPVISQPSCAACRETSLSGLTNGTTQIITEKPSSCSSVVIAPGSLKRDRSKVHMP